MAKADDSDRPDRLLTDPEAQAYLRLGRGTLANWRLRGGGPVFYRAGTRVLYWRSDLDAWLELSRRVDAQASASDHAHGHAALVL